MMLSMLFLFGCNKTLDKKIDAEPIYPDISNLEYHGIKIFDFNLRNNMQYFESTKLYLKYISNDYDHYFDYLSIQPQKSILILTAENKTMGDCYKLYDELYYLIMNRHADESKDNQGEYGIWRKWSNNGYSITLSFNYKNKQILVGACNENKN